MDHIPAPRLNREREIERIAKLKDISDRAKAVRPVDTGADRLDSFFAGGHPVGPCV